MRRPRRPGATKSVASTTYQEHPRRLFDFRAPPQGGRRNPEPEQRDDFAMTTPSLTLGTDHLPADPAPAVRALTGVVEGVHLPGTGAYEALTRTSNLAKAIRPLAVVEARDARDVGRTL